LRERLEIYPACRFRAILIIPFPCRQWLQSGAEGEQMVVVPLSKPLSESNPITYYDVAPGVPQSNAVTWVRFAAAGALVASGALLLTGRRRAGLVAAATGTSLALLDQKSVLRDWWKILPGYIGEVQRLLTQVQGAVDEVSTQRQKLGRVLGR
jgi:hypothetical protein